MEMEERRKSYSRRIITAVEETVMKKLRAKDEEIDKIGRLNWALEEKVKSLCLENQIWRELAQTNEATANALRNNLEQVLLAQQLPPDNVENNDAAAAALLEDAQSCCGSNLLAEEEDKAQQESDNGGGAAATSGPLHEMEMNKGEKRRKNGSGYGCGRLCRNCGKEEASVLLLPCRHLCLCGVCGPSLHSCPICLCTKNGTLHLNLSTSF